MKKIHIILLTIIIAAIAVLSFPITAYADMGPKPSIDLHVKNPPEGLYYVDILTDENRGEPPVSAERYNKEMLEILKKCNVNGLTPRFGGFMGIDDTINTPNEDHHYQFTYSVPDTFRVVIVTEQLETIISPEIKTIGYNCDITFDAAKCSADPESNSLTENIFPTVMSNIISFLITCSLTLLIERLIFLCYCTSLRTNGYLGTFIITNIITQLMLYGMMMLGLMIVLAEIAVMVTELIVFNVKMRKKLSHLRITACTMTANVVSAILGIPVFLVLLFLRMINL